MLQHRQLVTLYSLAALLASSYLTAEECPVCYTAPCCDPCDSGRFFVDAGFLYINAQMEELEYAASVFSTVTSMNPQGAEIDVLSDLKLHSPHFTWRPGVKASVGYESENLWNLTLTGLYFHSTAKSHQDLAPEFGTVITTFLAPLWNVNSMGGFSNHAEAKWKLHFGTLDLLVGGRFCPWSCVSLKPNFGLRGAWIEQSYKASYEDVGFFTFLPFVAPVPTITTSSFLHSRFRGIGFRAGLDFEADLFCHLSLVGGVGGSLVYGQNKTHKKLNSVFLESVGSAVFPLFTRAKIPEKVNRLAANLESELGLAYDWDFDCWGLEFSAKYLFSIWFDQNNRKDLFFTGPVFTDNALFEDSIDFNDKYANLFFQGLVLEARVDF